MKIKPLLFVFLSLFSTMSLFSKTPSPQQPVKPPTPSIADIKQFNGVPFANSIGIVVDAITLPIPQVEDAYNPSIIPTESGYTIAFRYDLPWDRIGMKKAKIGLLAVDRQFRPLGDATFLALDDQTEDPRLFYHGGTPYVSYTHLTFWGPSYLCGIGLSQLNPATQQPENSWDLLYKGGPREKNWAPFSYTNEKGAAELYFLYSLDPFKVVRIPTPINGTVDLPFPVDTSVKKRLVTWKKKWGELRGGTPALLVDGEYVTFFHSSFREQSHFWYVIGALTFDSKPPFALKRISQFPILFKDIYSTPLAKTRNQFLQATFPGGFVTDVQNDRNVFHLILGENDTSIKILTIDKETLYNYMKPVN